VEVVALFAAGLSLVGEVSLLNTLKLAHEREWALMPFHCLVIIVKSANWEAARDATRARHHDTFTAAAPWCSHPHLFLRVRDQFFVGVGSRLDNGAPPALHIVWAWAELLPGIEGRVDALALIRLVVALIDQFAHLAIHIFASVLLFVSRITHRAHFRALRLFLLKLSYLDRRHFLLLRALLLLIADETSR